MHFPTAQPPRLAVVFRGIARTQMGGTEETTPFVKEVPVVTQFNENNICGVLFSHSVWLAEDKEANLCAA